MARITLDVILTTGFDLPSNAVDLEQPCPLLEDMHFLMAETFRRAAPHSACIPFWKHGPTEVSQVLSQMTGCAASILTHGYGMQQVSVLVLIAGSVYRLRNVDAHLKVAYIC